MTFELYSAYVISTLIVLAIPGPTIMLVVSYSLTQGRKSAFATVMGVGLGDATAAAGSLMGLGSRCSRHDEQLRSHYMLWYACFGKSCLCHSQPDTAWGRSDPSC